MLRLTALRNDSGRAFTSARLGTAGLRDFVPTGPLQLLRFEARLQLPQGAPGMLAKHVLACYASQARVSCAGSSEWVSVSR